MNAMNALADKYGNGDKLNILAFPCNQFGHQSSVSNDELLNFLRYVRPGKGFEPAAGVTIFEKTEVNGRDAAPVFKWMKSELVLPSDGGGDTQNNGCADDDALILPRDRGATVEGREDSGTSLWMPVCRSDIAWNFEKFLVDKKDQVIGHYKSGVSPSDPKLKAAIEKALKDS